ncbi:MAG: fimbrial protein [Parabacteroides gordonii]|nr:fimbrial protein [Parabacteroides gordonii]
MKRNKIYMLLLSGLLMVSCSKEEEPATGGEEAFATVSVAVDGLAGTKADNATQAGSAEENAIKNLTAVFIDVAKNEVIGHAFKEITDGDENKVRVSLKTGNYRMLVIANTEETGSFTPVDYYGLTTGLEEQIGETGFTMSNTAREIEIKAGENNIDETVKRIAGRVDLSKLDVDWQDADLQNIEGLEFHLSQVFLANVRPQSYLFDMMGWSDIAEGETHPMEIKEGYLCGIDNYFAGGEIAKGNEQAEYLKKDFAPATIIKSGESGHVDLTHFYAMTNSDTKEAGQYPVILYIKGDLYDSVNGKNVLTDRYFRIKLAKGVLCNTLYKISATIQGKGSPEPGDNKENIDMSVTITVQTWDGVILDKIKINEEIGI